MTLKDHMKVTMLLCDSDSKLHHMSSRKSSYFRIPRSTFLSLANWRCSCHSLVYFAISPFSPHLPRTAYHVRDALRGIRDLMRGTHISLSLVCRGLNAKKYMKSQLINFFNNHSWCHSFASVTPHCC